MTDVSEQIQDSDTPLISFDEMPLSDDVKRALADMGYTQPTPVQAAVYECAVDRRDLVVQARTGTGKTAAFGIPLVDQLIKRNLNAPQALILTPTRELALQVANEIERIAAHRNIHLASLYGGAPIQRQIDALQKGAQIVVGTPGRVLDHLRRGTLRSDEIGILVLDESDEMLSMGFERELHAIVDTLPERHQTLLFSATLPPEIVRIAQGRLNKPQFIYLSGDSVGALEILHFVYMVMTDKTDALVRVIDVENPESALIFCNTKDETERVAAVLQRVGYDADWLNGDLPQNEREKVMARSKEGKLRFLVATDVAARGIDISHLTHVINYDFPESSEVYVHRTGRTGRMGRTGTAISLITPHNIGALYYLRLSYKIRPFEKQLPTEGDMKTREQTDIVAMLQSAFGEQPAHPDDIALARRLLTHDQHEVIIANLLRNHLGDRIKSVDEATEARRAKMPAPVGSKPEQREQQQKKQRTRGSAERADADSKQKKPNKKAVFDRTDVTERDQPSLPLHDAVTESNLATDSDTVQTTSQTATEPEARVVTPLTPSHAPLPVEPDEIHAIHGDPITLPPPPKPLHRPSSPRPPERTSSSLNTVPTPLPPTRTWSNNASNVANADMNGDMTNMRDMEDEEFDHRRTLRPSSYNHAEVSWIMEQQTQMMTQGHPMDPAGSLVRSTVHEAPEDALLTISDEVTTGIPPHDDEYPHEIPSRERLRDSAPLPGFDSESFAEHPSNPQAQSADYASDYAADYHDVAHGMTDLDARQFTEQEQPTGRPGPLPEPELPRYEIVSDAGDNEVMQGNDDGRHTPVDGLTDDEHGEQDNDYDEDPDEELEIFVNVGRKDGVRPGDFLAMLEKAPDVHRQDVGRIRIRDRNSFIAVRKSVLQPAIRAIHGRALGGRIASAQMARPRENRDRRESTEN